MTDKNTELEQEQVFDPLDMFLRAFKQGSAKTPFFVLYLILTGLMLFSYPF